MGSGSGRILSSQFGQLGPKAARQLVQYAGHKGWLSAVPDPKFDKKDSPSEKTRRAQLSKQGSGLVKLPEVEGYKYLVDVFEDLGMFNYGTNGPEVVKYQEIESYCNLTGTTLTPAEVMLIRRMSQEYVSRYYTGEDPGSAAPYTSSSDLGDSGEDLSDRILSVYMRRAANNKRNV